MMIDIKERIAHPMYHTGTWGMTLLLGFLLNMMFWTFIIAFKNKQSKIHKESEKANGVVSEENTSACFGHKCKKCGFDKAELIDMGVFVSDEDNLVFIKCGKCGFKERVGRRTS